ncbi:hypothetical protein AALG83_00455 [Christensenellaceae bacterium 44-20]
MKRKKLFLILGIALVCLAVGGYFIIDHMLNQDLQKQQQELDELANMQAATKSGETVEMELFSFADGRFFLKLPKSFAPMDESLIAVKYPSGNAPTHVFTNEQTTINVALNITENNMSDDEIAQYIKYMEQELENMEVLSSGVTEKSGRQIGQISFRSAAVDTDIYNHFLAFSDDGKLMLITFNCTVDLQDEWQPVGDFILESLHFPAEQ